MYKTLLVDSPADHVRRITLNRPDVMNALNTEMGLELREFFRQCDYTEEPDTRVLIITGAGERAFCAGGDLKQRQGMSDSDWRHQHEIFEDAFGHLRRFPPPIIAAVNGMAMGGGCEMAVACDLIVASENAVFAQPEVRLGIMPGAGGTQNLPRRIGPGRARDMVFTGRQVKAGEAFQWGLADRLVPHDSLMDEALALAVTIAKNGPIAVQQAKKAINWGLDLSLDAGLMLEVAAYNVAIPSEDRHEGVNAFNEKRPPNFKNR
ncbi:MAG: enoyl-CoA hydratase-related protein [SAR324 cluster bacterium]|nr:enoyl-CoA hydratase-related protein [SAR324 cluster bacterium]